MRRPLVLCLIAAGLLAPARLRGDDGKSDDFSRFLAQFQSAVTQRNQKKLANMMASKFDFIRATGVSHEVVFAGLAADGGRQWANLQDALQRRAETQQGARRVLQCTPTDVTYACYVVFEQNSQKHWQWQGLIMPTR